MQIKVKVKAKSVWDEKKIALVKKAARWCAANMNITKAPATIIIRLVGPHPLEFGSCSMVDKTKYIVWLHCGLSNKRTLSTLFHEMTHIRQHMFEGLYLHSYSLVEYRSQKYNMDDYWDSPWEKEARKSERKLYNQFIGAV